MEAHREKNPYAFPCMVESYIQEGMTLRDYLAAKAMQGLLSNSGHVQTFMGNNPNPVASYVAELSVQMADALLAELYKPKF